MVGDPRELPPVDLVAEPGLAVVQAVVLTRGEQVARERAAAATQRG